MSCTGDKKEKQVDMIVMVHAGIFFPFQNRKYNFTASSEVFAVKKILKYITLYSHVIAAKLCNFRC